MYQTAVIKTSIKVVGSSYIVQGVGISTGGEARSTGLAFGMLAGLGLVSCSATRAGKTDERSGRPQDKNDDQTD